MEASVFSDDSRHYQVGQTWSEVEAKQRRLLGTVGPSYADNRIALKPKSLVVYPAPSSPLRVKFWDFDSGKERERELAVWDGSPERWLGVWGGSDGSRKVHTDKVMGRVMARLRLAGRKRLAWDELGTCVRGGVLGTAAFSLLDLDLAKEDVKAVEREVAQLARNWFGIPPTTTRHGFYVPKQVAGLGLPSAGVELVLMAARELQVLLMGDGEEHSLARAAWEKFVGREWGRGTPRMVKMVMAMAELGFFFRDLARSRAGRVLDVLLEMEREDGELAGERWPSPWDPPSNRVRALYSKYGQFSDLEKSVQEGLEGGGQAADTEAWWEGRLPAGGPEGARVAEAVRRARQQAGQDDRSERMMYGRLDLPDVSWQNMYINGEDWRLEELESTPSAMALDQGWILGTDGSACGEGVGSGIVAVRSGDWIRPDRLAPPMEARETWRFPLPRRMGTKWTSAREAEAHCLAIVAARSASGAGGAPVVLDAMVEAKRVRRWEQGSLRVRLRGANATMDKRMCKRLAPKESAEEVEQGAGWRLLLEEWEQEAQQDGKRMGRFVGGRQLFWVRSHTEDEDYGEGSAPVQINRLANDAAEEAAGEPAPEDVRYPLGTPRFAISIRGRLVMGDASKAIRIEVEGRAEERWAAACPVQGAVARARRVGELDTAGLDLSYWAKAGLPQTLDDEWLGSRQAGKPLLDRTVFKLRMTVQGSHTSRLHYDVMYRERVAHFYAGPELAGEIGDEEIRECMLCNTREAGTWRHLVYVCPNVELTQIREETRMRVDEGLRFLWKGQDPPEQAVDLHPAEVGQAARWPRLAAGPYLLRRLGGPDEPGALPGGEQARDMVHRVVVPVDLAGKLLPLGSKEERAERCSSFLMPLVVGLQKLRVMHAKLVESMLEVVDLPEQKPRRSAPRGGDRGGHRCRGPVCSSRREEWGGLLRAVEVDGGLCQECLRDNARNELKARLVSLLEAREDLGDWRIHPGPELAEVQSELQPQGRGVPEGSVVCEVLALQGIPHRKEGVECPCGRRRRFAVEEEGRRVEAGRSAQVRAEKEEKRRKRVRRLSGAGAGLKR